MSEIKRKKNESFDAFMRRVKRRWQQSGRILQARKVAFFIPSKSKNVQKASAVSRAKKYEKINYLRKIGRLPAEENEWDKKRR